MPDASILTENDEDAGGHRSGTVYQVIPPTVPKKSCGKKRAVPGKKKCCNNAKKMMQYQMQWGVFIFTVAMEGK